MADEEEQLRESLKNHPHLTLDELREFKELFNLVCTSAHLRSTLRILGLLSILQSTAGPR